MDGTRIKKQAGIRIAALFCLALGLTLAGLWTDVVGYSVNLLPVASGVPHVLDRDAFLLGRLFAGLVLMVFARGLEQVRTTANAVCAIIMSTATASFIMAFHQTLLDPTLLAWCSIFTGSCCYLYLVSIFYIALARHATTEQAVVCIAASLVAETVFSILVSVYGDATFQTLAVIAAPLAALLCFMSATALLRRADGRRDAGEDTQADAATPNFAKRESRSALVAEVVILNATLVFVRALSSIGLWGETRTNFAGMTELSVGELAAIAALVFLLAAFVFIIPRRALSLPMRCTAGFAVMLAGLQLLALADDPAFGFSFDTVTTAVELFAHLVMWMMVIACIRGTEVAPLRITGLTGPVYAFASFLWIHVLQEAPFVTSALVMVIVYVLFLAMLVVIVRSNAGAGTSARKHAIAHEERNVAAFAAAHGLSPRETEICALLLEGKKRSEIEELCALSEGTVKTHLSHIYEKLDVHSKKEAAALFERECNERSTP